MIKKTERRQCLRIGTQLNVKEIDAFGTHVFKAISLSEGGMQVCIPLQYERQPRSNLNLEFYLPGDMTPIKTRGFVLGAKRCDEQYATSIVFSPMAIQAIGRIRRYVVRKKREELFDQMLKLHLGK